MSLVVNKVVVKLLMSEHLIDTYIALAFSDTAELQLAAFLHLA